VGDVQWKFLGVKFRDFEGNDGVYFLQGNVWRCSGELSWLGPCIPC